MPALSISSVRPTADTKTLPPVLYGATIAAGVPVYRNSADSKHLAADCDATAATRAVQGITITAGVDGGHGYVATRGSVILVGASMTEGVTYFLGPTAGQIVLHSDLGSGDHVVRIGTAINATELKLSIEDTGAQVP